MGLDATVYCNCWKEKKTAPLPFDSVLLVEEEGTLYLNETGLSKQEITQLNQQLSNWKETACPHPYFEQCSLRVGNWFAVSEFKGLLYQLGAKRFPILYNGIPDNNGGCIEAECAQQGLQELALFNELVSSQTGWSLIDAQTGEELYRCAGAENAEIAWSLKATYAFGKQGFLITERKTNAIIFQSVYFSQTVLPAQKEEARICFTDLKSKKVCYGSIEIGAAQKKRAEILRVQQRPLKAGDFWIVQPLKQLFTASLETGNPIYWH